MVQPGVVAGCFGLWFSHCVTGVLARLNWSLATLQMHGAEMLSILGDSWLLGNLSILESERGMKGCRRNERGMEGWKRSERGMEG